MCDPPGAKLPPVVRSDPEFTVRGTRPTELEFGEVPTLNLLFGGIAGLLMRLAWYIQVAIDMASACIFSWMSVRLVIVFMMEEVSWAATLGSLGRSFTNFRVDQRKASLLPDRLREAQPI